MRKIFPCGHEGKGQYCHRCTQKDTEMVQRVVARSLKNDQLAKAKDSLGIPCEALPAPVVLKAAEIFQSIKLGSSFTDYRGKRLGRNRGIVSIPVGIHHRLLCVKGQDWRPFKLLSHNDYDTQLRFI